MLSALCYQHCAKSSVLLRCFSTTWFNSGEFTLFWRALQNVAKYAFFVLLFWAKIFIRAIFYAFSISVYDRMETLDLMFSPHDIKLEVGKMRANMFSRAESPILGLWAEMG